MRRILLPVIAILLPVFSFGQFTYSWSTFTTGNSGLPDDLVTSLAYTSEDTLWIGTASGLAYLKDSTVATETEFPLHYITALATDDAGALWIGTAGNGCFRRLGPGNYVPYNTVTTSGQLTTDQILSLHCDGDSTWIGTDGEGLFLLYNSGWNHFHSGNHPFAWQIDQVYSVTADAQNRVWFGTSQSGAVRRNVLGTYWKFGQDSGFRYNHVRKIALQGDSLAWIGMASTGGDSALAAYNINTGTVRHYGSPDPNGYIQQNVWDIFIDSDNRKWIASNQTEHGLLLYNDTAFTAFGEFTSGILSNRTYAVAQDDSNRIWVGSFRGLSVNKTISTLSVEPAPLLVAGVYPNPASDIIHLNFSSEDQEVSISVLDLGGRTLMNRSVSCIPGALTTADLDISSCPPGIYLLRIFTGNFVKNLKVIKL